VRDAWERGRRRWPELDLPLERFAARAGDGREVQAEDLYLAAACADAVAGAAAAFRAAHREDLIAFALPILKSRPAAIEHADELLVELLVGGDAGPRLAGYSGRGPLRAWLRMTAVRRALNQSRDVERHAALDARLLRDAALADQEPEIAYMKERYGAAFEAAFRDALAALPPAQRALLALHHGQGLGMDAIAAMHRWSRPTASRRVAAAREALFEAACALVRQRLNVAAAEVESLFRLVRSQLDISLSALLADP
jgi:RNA polymerase sigma-70 factor (ECF subfamily)